MEKGGDGRSIAASAVTLVAGFSSPVKPNTGPAAAGVFGTRVMLMALFSGYLCPGVFRARSDLLEHPQRGAAGRGAAACVHCPWIYLALAGQRLTGEAEHRGLLNRGVRRSDGQLGLRQVFGRVPGRPGFLPLSSRSAWSPG